MSSMLLVVVLLTPGAPALKDATKPATLVGRWECTALTINGMADAQWKGLEYEFTADGTWVIYRDGKVIDETRRTYKHDPKANPATADVCEHADGTSDPAIYMLDGDALRMAIGSLSAKRPTSFEPSAGVMTFEFRRVKPKD